MKLFGWIHKTQKKRTPQEEWAYIGSYEWLKDNLHIVIDGALDNHIKCVIYPCGHVGYGDCVSWNGNNWKKKDNWPKQCPWSNDHNGNGRARNP